MSNDLVPVVPLYQGGASSEKNFSERDAIANQISELRRYDERGARAIIADAVLAGLSDFLVETLIKPLADALGVSVSAARKFWKDVASEARGAARRRGRQGVGRTARADLAGDERTAPARGCRSSMSGCGPHARRSPKAKHCSRIWKRSPAGSGWSAKAPRFAAPIWWRQVDSTKRCAICLLRRGAPAGGKNYLFDKTFALIPERLHRAGVERQPVEPRLLRQRG